MGCIYRGTLRPLCGLPPPCPLHHCSGDASILRKPTPLYQCIFRYTLLFLLHLLCYSSEGVWGERNRRFLPVTYLQYIGGGVWGRGQWPLSPLKSVGYTETDSFETH